MSAHYWHIERFERFVEKGTCACGAVKFFANDFCPEAIKTADDYNKKHGKPGDPNYHNVIKKEEIKTVKQGNVLPPIPPRPQLDDKKRGGGNCLLLHKYYMANKDAIVAYFDQLGAAETCAVWGISESGWRTLRADLMPDKYKKPEWAKPKTAGKTKRKYHKKEKSAVDTPSRAEIECEEAANVRDMRLLAEQERPIGEEEFNKEPRPLTEAEELYKQGLLKESKPVRKIESSAHNGNLPVFPAFNDSWPEKVQCTWLLVYQELMECAAKV